MTPVTPERGPTHEPDRDRAEEIAAELLKGAEAVRGHREKAQMARLARILADPAGRDLILALTDEALRIQDPARAAAVLRGLAADGAGIAALGPLDRAALRAGAALAPTVPAAVMPIVRERVRREMAGVILPAGRRRLAAHVAKRRKEGIRLNVNVLGEAVLGEDEAERRMARVLDVLSQPAVQYVSVKISSIASQLDVVRFDHEVDRIAARLRRLYNAAGSHRPAKFVNLDMEEYRDLELTLAVFRKVLDEPRYEATSAGIVLQTYLPDSLGAIEDLCEWAALRHERAGGTIKVRIVKGANLAMEHVDAEVHGWSPAPFPTKDGTDANYKRMLDVVLDARFDPAVRVGVASHNLFEVGWAAAIAAERGAVHRVEFEMLEGMSPAVAEVAAKRLSGLLLYAPLVERRELEAAIAYLVRRLDENSGSDNFIAHQFSMSVGSKAWEEERARFRRAVAERRDRPVATRRTQDRSAQNGRAVLGEQFRNEPDTDFTVAANRTWALAHLREVADSGLPEYRPVVAGRVAGGIAPSEIGRDPSRSGSPAYAWASASDDQVQEAIESAKAAGKMWASTPRAERRQVLRTAADEFARRRGRLLAVMAYDTGKTLREGDPEVSEAIDFATYYAEHIPEDGSGFRPYGTVVVASPWNFPLSIPAGGVLAALAAGNAVILKPAPEAVAVAGEMCQALWEGGIARDVLQFLPCVDGEASSRLITDPGVDGVVLTGSWDTARMFLGWRPNLNLHAETSGKNAIVITATADLDEAIADLVRSAFGHAGQKCSAASLAIVEASVYDDGRFLDRLADAVRSLTPGPSWDPTTTMGPLIRPPEGPLLDAVSRLDAGERWLVEPKPMDEQRYLWRPAVKTGVEAGSPFHMTECFGPVLGVMRAADLGHAIALQNQPLYGLTAGLQALDPAEIATWREEVHAGNLYVNKGTTGAIIQRQPFGGWKRSVVGAGAKAGGPNYVASLGTWPAAAEATPPDPAAYERSCRSEWEAMRRPVDPTMLIAESNAFRYRPLQTVVLHTGAGVSPTDVMLAKAAATVVGTEILDPDDPDNPGAQTPDKVRFLGDVDDATRHEALDAGLWVDDTPVAAAPERELLRWVREQAVSESRHRHGNITGRRPGLVPYDKTR